MHNPTVQLLHVPKAPAPIKAPAPTVVCISNLYSVNPIFALHEILVHKTLPVLNVKKKLLKYPPSQARRYLQPSVVAEILKVDIARVTECHN